VGLELIGVRSLGGSRSLAYSNFPFFSGPIESRLPGHNFNGLLDRGVRCFSLDAKLTSARAENVDEDEDDEDDEPQAGTKLTHRPREQDEFQVAKVQWSQVVTQQDLDTLREGNVQANGLESGVPAIKIGTLPGLAYIVPPRNLFAVVAVGPHQFKVTTDDVIYVEKLKTVDVNDKVVLPAVLLLGSRAETVLGRPHVPGAAVLAAVEQQTRDAKLIVFKKKRRKNYRRSKGHRQELTMLRILDIYGIEE